VVAKADAGPDLRRELVRIEAMAIEAGAWPSEAGAPLDDHALAGRVWEGLSQSPSFVPGSRHGGADAGPDVRMRRARMKVVYGVEISGAVMRGEVSMALDWIDGGDDAELAESVACEGDGGPDTAPKLVECAIMRGTEALVQKEKVRSGDAQAILAALEAADPALRQTAFAAIGERHVTQVVPRLLELLSSPDVLVRDGAIGALVALREPRAVKPLTELGQFHDLDMMRRIIDAVGAIGGEEARSYLELVASGHDNPAIRELATQALERMNRRSR
jgi:hypothetical protein